MTQVYEQLEMLQATLAGLSLEPEPAIRSPPSPQEDSYESTAGSVLSSANLWQNPAKLSLAPAPLHRGYNQPEESEESEASIGPLSAALRSWHLSPSHTPGSPAPRVALGAPTPAGPDSWMQGGAMNALEGSLPGSSASSQPPQIIINPARQKMLHKLALYEGGVLDSLQLLSASSLPATPGSQWPEESDEFHS